MEGLGGTARPGAGRRRTYRIVRVVSVDVALPDQFPTVTLEDTESTGGAGAGVLAGTGDAVAAGGVDGSGGAGAPGERYDRLAFRIGTAEGVALAHALAGTSAPRPSTHDLFALALERLGTEIVAVRLTGRIGPTYLAELDISGPDGREVLSCRPSDGICLALRQRVPAPVLCDEQLFVVPGDVQPPEDGGPPLPARATGVDRNSAGVDGDGAGVDGDGAGVTST